MVCLREGRDRSVEREREVLFVFWFWAALFFFLFRLGARKEERWGGLLSSLFMFKRELLGVWIRGG